MTITVLAAAFLAILAGLPRVVSLDHAAPLAAALGWLAALAARAVLVLLTAFSAALHLAPPLMAAVGDWCVAVPIAGTDAELVVTGHAVVLVAVLLPSAVVLVSSLRTLRRTGRDARRIRRVLGQTTVLTAPGGVVVLSGSGVLLATAGITRPRVVVSAGALVRLADDELAAGLDHERGHIRHGHRFVVFAADVLLGIAWFLPGAREAHTEARYHLERDADQWSLGRGHDPAALARAICAAALSPVETLALTPLTGGQTVRRVETLLHAESGRGPRQRPRTGLAIGLVAAAALAVLTVPATAAESIGALQSHQPQHHCGADGQQRPYAMNGPRRAISTNPSGTSRFVARDTPSASP